MKFNQALHLGRESKTSQAPHAWGWALWKSLWGLPSLLNLLDIPRSLLITLGFSSHPSFHTPPPLRLTSPGIPALAKATACSLFAAPALPQSEGMPTPQTLRLSWLSLHRADNCELCNPIQELNKISEWNSFWGEDHQRPLQSQFYDQHTSTFP